MITGSNPGAPYIRLGFEPATDFLRLKSVGKWMSVSQAIAGSNPGAPYIRPGFEQATDFLRLKSVQMLEGNSSLFTIF